MTPYGVAAVYQRFEGTCCLYPHGIEHWTKCSTLKMELAGFSRTLVSSRLQGVAFRKITFFLSTAVKILNHTLMCR